MSNCRDCYGPSLNHCINGPCHRVTLQAEKDAIQWAAWEKQNKEIERQNDLIRRLAGGAQVGCDCNLTAFVSLIADRSIVATHP